MNDKMYKNNMVARSITLAYVSADAAVTVVIDTASRTMLYKKG